MSHFETIKLRDVADVFSGYAFNATDMNSIEGIPLIKIKNVNYKKVSKRCDSFLNVDALKKQFEKFFLRSDDFLVAMTGQGSVGRIGKMRGNSDRYLVNQRVGIIRTKLDLADPEYLYQCLARDEIEQVYFNLAMGAGQPNLSPNDIGNLSIPFPPLRTQQKIAAILSSYDDLIENNLKRIKLLEEMAQITYEEWFVRLKFPGHETTLIDSETGLPVGWEKTTLGNCCFLVMGQSPKSEFYNFEKEGLPFHQGVKDYGFRFPENACWSTDGLRIAKAKDILFSVRAPVGRLNIAIESIILGRGLSAIRHKQGSQSFLFYQLKQIFFQEDMIGGGAIYASVTKEDMLRIELLKPDQHTETEFNKFVAEIDQTIENLYLQNQFLKEARDILLPRLMTGMIDVEQLVMPEPFTNPSATTQEPQAL